MLEGSPAADDLEPVRTIIVSVCDSCGKQTYSKNACDVCGVPIVRDESSRFRIPLTFAAEECPGCGLVAPPGECSVCGVQVPEPEPGETESARAEALGPLAAQAAGIAERLESLPVGHVVVTTNQFVTTITDAKVFSAATEILAFCHRVHALNLGDRTDFEDGALTELQDFLRDVERLAETARRAAWFSPPAESQAIQDGLLAAATRAAEIARDLLLILSARTWREASHRFDKLQYGLSDIEIFEEFSDELDAISLTDRDDLDARLGLIIGIEGIYTDAIGMIDLGAVYLAASSQSESVDHIGDGAARYLSHLLSGQQVGSGGVGLLLSAVALASADRPMPAHITALLARELFDASADADRDQTIDALHRYAENGGRVFDSTMRVRRELRLLNTAELESPEDVVIGLVSVYRRMVEGSLRPAIALIDELQAITLAGPSAKARTSTMLGQLVSRLSRRDDELSAMLAGTADSQLRNAEAHEDFRIDAESLDVVLGDRRISLDELEDAIERVGVAVSAIDAATQCFALDHGVDESVAWLKTGERPAVVEQIVDVTLGAFGYELFHLDLAAVTAMQLSDSKVLTLRSAMSIANSTSSMFPKAETIEISNSSRVVRLNTAPLRRWRDSPLTTQDLAIVACLLDEAVESTDDASSAYVQALVIMARLVVGEGTTRLTERNVKSERERLVVRLRFVCRAISSWPKEARSADREFVRSFRQARELTEKSIQVNQPQLAGKALGLLVRSLERHPDVPPFPDD